MTSKRWVCAIIMMMTLATLLSACGDTGGGDGKVTVKMFFHSGSAETDALKASIKAFEAQNSKIHVDVKYINEGSYDEQVAAAAISKKLPCILDINGPSVYNYAWHDYLTPLDNYLNKESGLKSDLLPAIIKQGTYNNHIYSLGQYDAGLGLYANTKLLAEAGITDLPTFDKPWNLDEFNDVLAKLKKASGNNYPLDMMMSYGVGEWYTYAFSPFLQSFGGDLINRSDYQSAKGVLNGPEAVQAMTWFQNLFKQGYVNPSPADANDFPSRKSALAWSGSWMYNNYEQGLGNDMKLLPAPNLGKGAKTGMGSWGWGITSSTYCKNPDEAWEVVDFLLSKDEVKRVTDDNKAVPARKSVLDESSLFTKGDAPPLRIFAQQLQSDMAVPRPATGAYPTITQRFYQAAGDIRDGADVKKELDQAVEAIDSDIKDNRGYKPK